MGKYAVVYLNGKKNYLGLYGSEESKVAYARFIAELQANPTGTPLPNGEKHVTVRELTAAFLDHAKQTLAPIGYSFYRVIILDFMDKLYGDGTTVYEFLPKF
jgi:hypothetical protein